MDDPLFDPVQVRQGPPVKQMVKRGTIGGSIDYEDFREVYEGSPELRRRRHPFRGADYAVRAYRHSILQGQSAFRYRDGALWLVHNFFCWQMAGTAEMPWSCDSTVFVLRGARPVAGRAAEDGFELMDPDQVAEVEGDFDHVVPHPSQPIFAAIRLGCCGGESRVSVQDLEGRTLCPAADVLIGWGDATGSADAGETGVWDRIKVAPGRVDCPGGSRASFAPSPP